MAKKSRAIFLRILSRLLAPGRGEVRALEEAMHDEKPDQPPMSGSIVC